MKHSAGIILYRNKENPEVFLVHPGGPYWWNKDKHSWSIPKGKFKHSEEEPLEAAKREFKEETGFEVDGNFSKLEPFQQRSDKIIYPFVLEGDLDSSDINSDTFEMEWPPDSGNIKEFPEVDKGEWFNIEKAKEKIHKNQKPVLEKLLKYFESGKP
ncbi:MAG: NUDIX domain-containing protein [Candidatus Magasanikbacteria bacterium]